jgi:transposase InsO family protein
MLIMGLSYFLNIKVSSIFFAGVNHSQSSGEIEKCHDLYIKHRGRFASLDSLVDWYNNEKPYGALNLNGAETPSEAFIRKMRPEVWVD